MSLLLLGLFLLGLLATIPLARRVQRRPTTPEPVARALGLGLRWFWIGMTAILALGVISISGSASYADALAAPFLPFLGIAAGGVALLVAFLFSITCSWLQLDRTRRWRRPVLLRVAALLIVAIALVVLLAVLRPIFEPRAFQMARSPEATGGELRALYLEHPEDQAVIAAIGRNATASPELLEEMALANAAGLFVLAAHPRLPIRTIRKLAGDERPSLRRAVAGNPALPEEHMDILRRDPVSSVRAALAANPAATGATLRVLAADSNDKVRWTVAANVGAPEALLEELSAASDPAIASRARQSLELQAKRRALGAS